MIGYLRIRWIFYTRHYRCHWFHRAWHRIAENGRTAICKYCGAYWVRS